MSGAMYDELSNDHPPVPPSSEYEPLPSEIHLQIARHIPYFDLRHYTQACKTTHQTAQSIQCPALAQRHNQKIQETALLVVVSVTERSQRDLTKRFNETKINWTVVERQLRTWAQYFQKGKKLRLNLSFNYVEATRPATRAIGRMDKRNSTSATGDENWGRKSRRPGCELLTLSSTS